MTAPTDSSNNSSNSDDWRIRLFGDFIQSNPKQADVDVEAFQSLVPTEEALNQNDYDYVAVFLGADYCPHCKAFAPTVQESAQALKEKRCKIIFASNDRSDEAFQASCAKNAGLDVMPYDLEKTRAMRDLFDLKTIPALMILKNGDFHEKDPTVVSNGRHALVADPEAKHFPWSPSVGSESMPTKAKMISTEEPMTTLDRLVIRGKYGKWYELGHHVNPEKPDEMYMDEHAVRIRAGILNIITWIVIINISFWRNSAFVEILYPFVAFEFIVSANMGLGPLAPMGVLATVIASALHPEPYWKPARPKRFAWYIGLGLATTCLIFYLSRDYLGDAYYPLLTIVAGTCNLATWLESSCGFCIGCFIYNKWMVPLFKLEECSECKL